MMSTITNKVIQSWQLTQLDLPSETKYTRHRSDQRTSNIPSENNRALVVGKEYNYGVYV